jgi:predicted S18 family serine protease
MGKKILWLIPVVVILILLLFLFFGREKPPTQELANAEKAVAEAKEKEADLYAQDLFSKAEDSLKRAKDLNQEKKYKEAKKAAEETVTLAREAMTQGESNKAKMKADIEQMILEVRKKIDELKTILAKSPKKMGPQEKRELQALIQKWEDVLNGIEGMVKDGKIRQAYDQLVSLKKEVDTRYERSVPSPEERMGIK